jgi:alpha-mannosidase
MEVLINIHTGLMDRYRVGGADYLEGNAFNPLVIQDNPDPWGMRVRSFRQVIGGFELLSQEENLAFSGVVRPELPAVRVIEDGAVRTVVEAVLGYRGSRICIRYKLPKRGLK